MAKDPYKLLGVPKSASDAEIRKAYRALAKKLHPDVNPNDEKAANRFKEITAAYTLLTDKKMRRQYDSGQVDGSGQQQNPFAGGGNPFGGFQRAAQSGQMGPGGVDDMSDLFASLFGMNMGGINRGRQTGGMNRGGYGQRTRPQAKRGSDIRVKMKLDFLDALKGGTKRLKIGTQSGVNVKIPAGVIDGAVIRLPGKGRPGTHGGRAGMPRSKLR